MSGTHNSIITPVNQFNAAGELTHLLTLEGLPKEQILHILDTAQQFVSVTDPAREVKKYHSCAARASLIYSLKTLRVPALLLRLPLSVYQLM